jgi:ankyrin repeat protein
MLCCESDSQSGWTALINAGYMGHAECVRLLIDAGANKDARNNVRRRCLICVSRLSHFSYELCFYLLVTICNFLISNGTLSCSLIPGFLLCSFFSLILLFHFSPNNIQFFIL